MSAQNTPGIDSRRHRRKPLQCEVAVNWKAENGATREDSCLTVDMSESGMGLESWQQFTPDSKLIVRADTLQVAYLSTVRYCRWERDRYRLGLEFVAKTTPASRLEQGELDLYGMLRLNRQSDPESIDRVYKTLARRYHPDNLETGDPEAFLCLSEAYRILSDPGRKQAYDDAWDRSRSRPAPVLESRELFTGITGEQNRRFAILCLLYKQRMIDVQTYGLTTLDLAQLTGSTTEEVAFSLWYLAEKKLVTRNNDSSYCITADGVDHVELRRHDFVEPVRLIEASTRPSALAVIV